MAQPDEDEVKIRKKAGKWKSVKVLGRVKSAGAVA